MWLGIERRTGQYVIYDRAHGGLRDARTIKPMPRGQQLAIDMIEAVDVTPWSSHTAPPRKIELQAPKKPEDIGRKPIVRRVYIKQSDLDLHGYTEHCPRCDHIREGKPGKAPTIPRHVGRGLCRL